MSNSVYFKKIGIYFVLFYKNTLWFNGDGKLNEIYRNIVKTIKNNILAL